LQRRLGIARQVVIQPSTYGADNRVTLDAAAAFGMRRAPSWSSTTAFPVPNCGECISGESAASVSISRRPDRPPGNDRAIIASIGDLGWHIEVDVWAAELPEIIPILDRVRSTVVLDHLGHIPEPEGCATRSSQRSRTHR